MAEFKKMFVAYGADYENTMRRFLGKEAIYLKMLNMLPKDDNLQKLGETLKAGDLEGAFNAAHTLKGVAGNLGLTPLYQAVCTIVESLRVREARNDYAQMYAVIQAEYKRVEALLIKEEGSDQT